MSTASLLRLAVVKHVWFVLSVSMPSWARICYNLLLVWKAVAAAARLAAMNDLII